MTFYAFYARKRLKKRVFNSYMNYKVHFLIFKNGK